MPIHDTGRSGGAALGVDRHVFPAGSAPGTPIAALSDPFAGLGLGATAYATFGSVPAQLALADGAIVAGTGAAVAGTAYALGVLATSGDGRRETGETIVLTAQAVAATPGTALSLPAVAVAPLAVWSPYRLVAAHAGATLHAVAAGDIATAGDGSPVPSGIGASGDAVDIVYDQSGNGHHLTQADAALRPTLTTLARQGVQPVSFTAGASMRMPDGVSGEHRAVTLFDVYGYNSLQNGSPGRLGEGQGDAATLQFGANFYNAGAVFAGGVATAVGARAMMMQPQVVSYIGGAAAARIGSDGVFGSPAAAPVAASFAGGYLGRGTGGGDGGLQFLARVIYPAALSDADEAAVRGVLNAVFATGGFAAAPAQIVVNGNSIEYGAGTLSVGGGNGVNGWVRQMIPRLKRADAPVVSLAAGRLYLRDLGLFGGVNDGLYRPGLTNLCVALEPTNDIAFLMGQLDATVATFTADSSAGSPTLTNVSSTAGLVAGQSIRGGASDAGGFALRTIVAVGAGSVTLSAPVSTTTTGLSYVAGARYTGSIVGGSTVVTGLAGTAGLAARQLVEAPGLAAGTTIASVDGADRITLSVPATAGGSQTLVATDPATVQAYAEALFDTCIRPFVAARQARGFAVLVPTVLPRRWGVYTATRGQMNLARGCYNDRVAAMAASLGYTLLDRGGIAALADPADPVRYAGDGTHPTDAGAALIAGYAAGVVNSLLP